MTSLSDAVTETAGGVLLDVEVSAGSRQMRFPAGFNPWRTTILCKVPESPRDGKANAAVLALIADTLRVPVSRVQIRSGSTSHTKKIFVAGITRSDAILRLSEILP